MECKFIITKTENATQDDFELMYNMIMLGGQIHINEEILRKNIRNSFSFAYCIMNDDFVGCAAIKIPQNSYRRKVFERSGIPEHADMYYYEMGYCVTHPNHRGKGICSALIQELLDTFEGMNFFATTKSEAMKHIFNEHGFSKLGNEYSIDESELIQLYTYTV